MSVQKFEGSIEEARKKVVEAKYPGVSQLEDEIKTILSRIRPKQTEMETLESSESVYANSPTNGRMRAKGVPRHTAAPCRWTCAPLIAGPM